MKNDLDTSTKRSASDASLTKPNELLVMVPIVGKLSPVSRKLFNALLYRGGREFQRRLADGNPMLAEETFEARLSELVAHLPGEAADWSTNAHAHLKEMLRTEVVWESIDKNSVTTGWGAMNLLSQAEFDKKGGAWHLRWAFPPRVLAALKDPAFYTRLDLDVIGSLRTYASIALYEVCARYRTNPTGVTCSQPPEWWVEALTARAVRSPSVKGASKQVGSEEQRVKPKREWRKVKSESVLDAIVEINAKTDLEIELIEKRTGKAVTEVQFAVRRKRRALVAEEGVPPDMLAQAISLGISASDISILARTARGGHDILKAALKKLGERVNREDLEPISSAVSYLKSILGELDLYIAEPVAAEDVKPRKPDVSRERLTPAVQDVIETPDSLAKRHVESLDREAQEHLAKLAFAHMREKGLATASVSQSYARYMDGGPLVGVLLGEMARQHQKLTGLVPVSGDS